MSIIIYNMRMHAPLPLTEWRTWVPALRDYFKLMVMHNNHEKALESGKGRAF